MRTVSTGLLPIACVALLCASAPALGKTKTHAPPGNSGVDEYLEVVPDGGGGRPVGKPKNGAGHALSPKARSSLRSYGRDGQATAGLAEATATKRSAKRMTPGSLDAGGSNSSDSGVLAAIKRVVASAGAGFIGLLLAVLASGTVLGLRRRRSSDS
jgi:hypothetical protein